MIKRLKIIPSKQYMKFKNKEEEKSSILERNKSCDNINNVSYPDSLNKNKTSRNIKKFNRMKILSLKEFPGFFFKKFDLISYKKEKDIQRERSKSKEKKYSPNLKRGNGIPDNLIDRLKFLKNIYMDEKFQKYYNKKPKNDRNMLEKVTSYILNYSKKNTELEAILMAYYYVCNEIKYVKNSNENDKINNKLTYTNNIIFQKADYIFEKGKSETSIGFTNLFESFLKKIEIKFKHIDGYCKLLDNNIDNKNNSNRNKLSQTIYYESFNENYINHSWNAVYIKGYWYFIDCLFGSGGLVEEKEKNPNVMNRRNSSIFKKPKVKNSNFNIFYFLTPAEFLITTHRPIDDEWQLIEKTISLKEFNSKKLINYGEFYKGVINNDVELISHKNHIIKINIKEELIIKFRIEDKNLEINLYYKNGMTKIGELKYSRDSDQNIWTIEPTFPKCGEYILKIKARPTISNDIEFKPLFDYIIKVTKPNINNKFINYFDKYILKSNETKEEKSKKEINFLPNLNRCNSQYSMHSKIISDYSKIFPGKFNKKVCYDDQDFNLLEPKNKFLRKGAVVKFKLKIKGATNVTLLDGNKWTPMKRTVEDVYECLKEIETDNVSICCLRGRNVYTELIKFLIHKERSILSNSQYSPITKRNKKFFVKNKHKEKSV